MVPDAQELLTANLPLVERAVAFACRRYRLQPEEAEEITSVVHLKLVENDYAVLRSYEGRSSLATFINIVVQRLVLDHRIHEWGKWHASAEARRLGPIALELEQLLFRDGRSREDALPILAGKHEGVTRESLEQLAARLPARAPRRRVVPLEEANPVPDDADEVEERALDRERRDTADRLKRLLAAAFEQMPDDDRLVLQLRFEQGMTVAQIARALGRDQKFLYRQIERRMREIRAAIEQSGVASPDVLDLIGRDEAFFAFDFGKHQPRPSIAGDGKEMAQPEEPE